MEVHSRHGWEMPVTEAIALQKELAAAVIEAGELTRPRLVGGVDVSAGRHSAEARAAFVVLAYPSLELVDKAVVTGRLTFPYVPGLLSFREMPLLLQAAAKLNTRPDVVLVDGQGRAHPRRLGLACHLGLFLDLPTVGVAKSRLFGQAEIPGIERGESSPLLDADEVIGLVLRTRRGVRPLYVSVGHRLTLKAAREIVLGCGRGYRLPEPTRLAHLAAGDML